MKTFYVLAFVIGWQTNVGFVNRHCHKKEIKRHIQDNLFSKNSHRRAASPAAVSQLHQWEFLLSFDDLGTVANSSREYEGMVLGGQPPSTIVDYFPAEPSIAPPADGALHTLDPEIADMMRD
jgi:hypothetical protein